MSSVLKENPHQIPAKWGMKQKQHKYSLGYRTHNTVKQLYSWENGWTDEINRERKGDDKI